MVYIKGKKAFFKKEGIMQVLGNPINLARNLHSEGYRLIHIIDESPRNISPNFDIYDALTTFMNIEVECENRLLAKKLLSIKSRIAIRLPPSFSLEEFKEDKRLIVGMVRKGHSGDISQVHDLIIQDADDKSIHQFHKKGKRIIISRDDFNDLNPSSKRLVWGVLMHDFS